MLKRLRKSGVTLIEAVLFVGVALAVIVGGLVFWQQASISSRTQETTRLLSAMMAESMALNQITGFGSGSETGDLEPILVKSGAIPTNAIQGDQIVSPWGGDVITGALNMTCGRQAEFVFTIGLEDVPPKVCARLAAYRSGGNGSFTGNLFSVSIQSPVRPFNPTLVDVSAYTDLVPPTCFGSDANQVDPSLLRPDFPPHAAGDACARMDPDNNRVLFGVLLR